VFQHLVLHYTYNWREGHFCHHTCRILCVLISLKDSPFIHPSYSQMEQICLTSLMDIDHGLIILRTWSKRAHGVITWFSMRLQIAIKCTFAWLAVSQISVTILSGLMVTWSARTHLCWAMFMKFTTLACDPNKVRLHATHCVVRQFVGNIHHFNSYKVKLTISHCIIRQVVGNFNVYYFKPYKAKLTTSHCTLSICHVHHFSYFFWHVNCPLFFIDL